MMRIAISVFLSVMILCTAVMTGVSAADNTPALLTVTDVLMINDSQLIIRFSEPAAFNLLGKNRGPYIALRVVDADNRLQYAGGTVPLQYRGRLCFTDSAHDTVLFTYDDGVNDIVSLLRFEGDLAPFAGRGYELKLAIEEVPFDQSSPSRDGLIDNITTADGKTKLSANLVGNWDGQYCEIKEDRSISVDSGSFEDITDPDGFDYGKVLSVKSGNGSGSASVTAVTPDGTKKNSILPVAVLAGCAVFSALLVGLALSGRKKHNGGERK